MTIQDYNHPDCLHGFPEWAERQLDRVLSETGCPSCQAERIVTLEAKVEKLEKAAKGVRHLVESAAIAHLGKVPDESGLEWVRVPAWFVDGLVDEVTPEPPGEQHE